MRALLKTVQKSQIFRHFKRSCPPKAYDLNPPSGSILQRFGIRGLPDDPDNTKPAAPLYNTNTIQCPNALRKILKVLSYFIFKFALPGISVNKISDSDEITAKRCTDSILGSK